MGEGVCGAADYGPTDLFSNNTVNYKLLFTLHLTINVQDFILYVSEFPLLYSK